MVVDVPTACSSLHQDFFHCCLAGALSPQSLGAGALSPGVKAVRLFLPLDAPSSVPGEPRKSSGKKRKK